MISPENTPTNRDEYTSLVIRARPSAKSGGTIDQAPVEISSKPSMGSLLCGESGRRQCGSGKAACLAGASTHFPCSVACAFTTVPIIGQLCCFAVAFANWGNATGGRQGCSGGECPVPEGWTFWALDFFARKKGAPLACRGQRGSVVGR